MAFQVEIDEIGKKEVYDTLEEAQGRQTMLRQYGIKSEITKVNN